MPQVVLVALPGADVGTISKELDTQCSALPRNETARRALSHSFCVEVRQAQRRVSRQCRGRRRGMGRGGRRGRGRGAGEDIKVGAGKGVNAGTEGAKAAAPCSLWNARLDWD